MNGLRDTRVSIAVQTLVPLTGIRIAEDHAEATAAQDYVEPTAAEVQREYHTDRPSMPKPNLK